MPKIKTTTRAKCVSLAQEYEKESFVVDGTKLICRSCIQEIPTKRSQVLQHLNTVKHQKNVEMKMKQKLLNESCGDQQFKADMCKVGILSSFTSPAIS